MAAEKKTTDGLPNVEKGTGGAGRVSGLLSEDKAQDTKGTLARLLITLKPFAGLFILALILTLMATIASVLAPRLTGQVITLITETLLNRIGLDWQSVTRLISILATLYLVIFVATYAANRLMVSVTQKIIRSLRVQMDKKINLVPLSFYDQVSVGNVSSLLTNDLDNIANTLQTGLTSSLNGVITMIGVLIMMFSISPLLALFSVIILPLNTWLVSVIVRRSKPTFRQAASYTGHLNGVIEEAYQGAEVIKAYGLEEQYKEEVKECNQALYEKDWRSSYVSFLARPAGDLMANINYAIISILGGWLVITGRIPIGDFQAFISYVHLFRAPFGQILGIFNTIMSALASAERIFEFLDTDEQVETGTKELDQNLVKGDVEFDNVTFRYVEDQPLFENVNIEAESGKQIAIVGQTGAGKTTLINLLLHFYELNGGQILLDGKPTTEYQRSELRKAFSLVLQDTWLFAGTIRDNIAYGASIKDGEKLSAVSDEDVVEAAKRAHANHFIERLPNGYDTEIVEGATGLSQGEKQLLTIARALIKKAPITILDEATSSVDTRTELQIQKAMHELTSSNTSFIIAHRLSTIRNADLILVMEDGQIMEQGNHRTLLEKNGLYAELYHAGSANNVQLEP